MKRHLTISLLLHISLLGLYAQPYAAGQETDALTRYARNIINFNREHPQEKVYLHMDNRSYFLGDTIWFKAYVVNAVALQPSSTSGVLYVELLDENGVEKDHKKLRLQGGMCHGDFILKEEYRTGYYEIRAYTRNMLNFGNEAMSYHPYFAAIELEDGRAFSTEVRIAAEAKQKPIKKSRNKSDKQHVDVEEKNQPILRGNSSQGINHTPFSRVFPVYAKPDPPYPYKREMEYYPVHSALAVSLDGSYELRENNLTVRFYPEGGALVGNVSSVVAFEAVDQWGRKRDISGYVTDEEGNKVAVLNTVSRGRGTFTLTPQLDKVYTAHVTYMGKAYAYEVPQCQRSGCALRLTPPIADGSMSFIVSTSADREGELVGWSLQCRGGLIVSDTLRLGGQQSKKIVIPSSMLVAGVNQLTLFNIRGEVLADRLFFVCPPYEQASLLVAGIQDAPAPYGRVTLDMQMKDGTRNDVAGFFSIAVTDADELVDTYDTGDMRSELLLSSDLKGFIEDSDSYFQHSNDTVMAADIDLLMLVQGWRRYEWCTMAGSKAFNLHYPPESGLGIDGYVISARLQKNKFGVIPEHYDRMPHLGINAILRGDGVVFKKRGYVDSLGHFSIPFDGLLYEEIPMTVKLTDTLNIMLIEGGRKVSRLKYGIPVINRVFSPRPCAYSYYQRHTRNDEYLPSFADTVDWSMEGEIEEVKINKRYKNLGNIHYERPEMVIDYYKEWNNLIDRGVPLSNGPYEYNQYSTQTLRLNYSLPRLNIVAATLKKDAHLRQQEMRGQHKAFCQYLMPKSISVYSNLIGRDGTYNDISKSRSERPVAYLVTSYCDPSETPSRPPYILQGGSRDTYFEGYSRVHSFYSPDYSECALPDSADYRRTLYWNPNVETDNQGRASVTFYNSKQTKHLHVRAEGFTRFGEMVVYDSEKEKRNQ